MAVFDVILNDKITDLKDLLQADPKCANSVGWHGLTPLHHAALKNNEELIDLLLQYGANINHPNAYRETPLHLACQAASLKLVHKLLEIGADLRAEDSAGRTCVHHAAKSGSVLKLHYLTECGLSLKKRDNRGLTALHIAAENSQLEATEYLIRHKRFPTDVRDSGNCTPLHLAAKHAHCEVAWVLESKSTLSMINEPDVMGKTPLDYASDVETPRHLWLKRHLKYWQASRCPRSRPPNPWMPWFLLLLSPSFGIFLIALSFYQLPVTFAILSTVAIVIFFNIWSFSKHRLQHISAVPSPALAGSLYSNPGVVTSNRISDTGESLNILDVAKGVIPESQFCTVCEIVMPEFTKHCKLCEVCIESLDHHCLFLMNCVARNNHRAFVCFMTEIIVANALFVFLGEASSFGEAMSHDVYVSVLFILNCIGLFYLTFFQFKVITDGGTTYYSSEGGTMHRESLADKNVERPLGSQRSLVVSKDENLLSISCRGILILQENEDKKGTETCIVVVP
ncbi:hypothetical protein pdam_00017324 [Pocillopora damicornis]|uniref:Palmitoyltransferase n=1 Tax=Pocillopora damicornis TaxID=46731 RepID=A0A3M6TLB2_POCDA|nr:hypothetical protein pdam_00017324 [Pocillopora damicornis]